MHVDGNAGALVFGTGGTFHYTCKTPAYVAGASERAVITVNGTVQGVPVGSGVGVRPGYSVNAAADATMGLWHYQRNNGNGTTNLSNSMTGTIDLTPGAAYVFSTAITDSDGGGFTSAVVYCNTVVMIVKV